MALLTTPDVCHSSPSAVTPADPLALEALFAQKTCAPAHYWQNNWKLQLLPRACSKVGIFGHGCSAAQSARRAFAARAAKVYYDCSVCEGLALLWQQLLGSWPSHFVGTYIRLSVATWHARFCNLYLAHGRGGSVQRRLCPCSRAVQGAAGSERHSVRRSRNALCKSGWHMPEVPLVLPRDKPSTATVRMTALAFLMTTSACSVAALTFGALSATVQLLLIVLIAVMLLGSAHQCVPLPLWKCMLYLFASSALYVDVSALDYLYTSECVVDGPQFSYAYYLSASSVVSSIFGACAAILFQPKLQGFSFRQCVALWDGRQVRGVVGRHYAGEPVERWPR